MFYPLDLSNTTLSIEELIEYIRQIELTELEMAAVEQRHIAANSQDRVFMDEGELQMRLQSKFYHHWGQREGYECWGDKTFKKECMRDNPEVRVKSRSRKIMTGYTGENSSRNVGEIVLK